MSLSVYTHARHINHLEIRQPLVGVGSLSTTIWVLEFEAWGLPVLGGGGRISLALVQVSKHRMIASPSIYTAKSKGSVWREGVPLAGADQKTAGYS